MWPIYLTSWPAHPLDCPDWDYERHPDSRRVLPTRIADLLTDLASGAINTRDATADTRPIHRRLFVGLAPPAYDYFAGHYRGEPFRCLRHYGVGVTGDPRVGMPPNVVSYWMQQVQSIAVAGIDAIDADVTLNDRQRLGYLIVLCCRVFELFLRIHPYANGNGHSARFIVWCILGRYRHWPRRWTIDPRPNHLGYLNAIVEYRNGNRDPLETLLASML